MASEKIEQFILCSLDLHGLAQIHPQEYQDEAIQTWTMSPTWYVTCSSFMCFEQHAHIL